ncbi:hypothetical protein NJ7G_3218 [Natrinema sp. J7-2]|nr:hypothetical protein NJ7G_3218 [Natrinema sp. J7-2]
MGPRITDKGRFDQVSAKPVFEDNNKYRLLTVCDTLDCQYKPVKQIDNKERESYRE